MDTETPLDLRGVTTLDTLSAPPADAVTPAPGVQPPPSARPVYVKPPQPRNRLGSWVKNKIISIVGLPWQRRLARAALFVPYIRRWEEKFDKLNDDELRTLGQKLRGRGRGGEELDDLLPEAFGLVCVAAKRRLNLRPFDVQLAAGVIMHQGGLAELATGEGKTLCATLPAFLNGLSGKGVHVATVNDYLARRDAEEMGKIYTSLGLSVGCLQQQMPDQDRYKAYRADITYGTASEFGFDFLRDRLKVAGQKGQDDPFWAPFVKSVAAQAAAPKQDNLVQRAEHYYALVDEADNIFIDDAKTPLIIASETRPASPDEQIVFKWANEVAMQMEPVKHFDWDVKKQKLELTTDGKRVANWANPPVGKHSHAMDKLYEHIEQSLHAHHRFRRDQHYMVDEKTKKVIIIDEGTGRSMPDRHWREGLHQAVEAKEGVTIHKPSDHAAQITFQSFFKLYKKLSGMTGTAAQNWFEIRRVYKIWVVCVPTNRPVVRNDMPDRVFANEDEKFAAAVETCKRLKAEGRSVLVGTRSVEKSEKLSALLRDAGVEHQVLNARQNEAEAMIISKAGEIGRITIATNMAGRGTDIKPANEVLAAGGLHVLGTERHDAKRIDRQLAGRAGRQGDPGTSQFYLCLEDELLEGLGYEKRQRLEAKGRAEKWGGDWSGWLNMFRRAQKKVESKNRRQRVDLMVYEKQRQEVLKDLGADPYVD
jgi:preprotein translocase subunit SecA